MTPQQILEIGIKQKSFPHNLVKYRSDDMYTENMLQKNEIWFSNPLLFNDPYDCNTPIDINTTYEEIIAWLKDTGVEERFHDIYAQELLKNPNAMKEKTEDAMKNLRVCCFSTLENSIIQWSYYSAYHKGLCFVFDIEKDLEFFTLPIIVGYRDVIQHYNHFIHKNNIVEYLIKPKYSGWSYESEVRIVKTRPQASISDKGDVFNYKDETLKEIIFGANATKDTIIKYKNLCRSYNKAHVKFFKMELGHGVHYELWKQPV